MSTALTTAKPGAVGYAGVQMSEMGAGGMLAPKSLGEVVAFAQVMARADLALPKHLRGNDGACMAVAMQAMRWEMDPFAVANKTYSVNDRLAFEAQLVAAVVHTRAPIARRPEYSHDGEGPTRRCTVTCEMKDGTTRTYTSPMFKDITTKNSPLWKSDPDQQLGYYSIRSWARRHTPEVILGVYTPDEVADFRDVTPAGQRPATGLAARLSASAPASSAGFARTIEPGPTIDQTSSTAAESSPDAADEGGGPQLDGDEPADDAGPQASDAAPVEVKLDTDLGGLAEEAVLAWIVLYREAMAAAGDEGAVKALRKTAFDGGQLKVIYGLDPQLQQDLDKEIAARLEAVKAPPTDDEFPGDKIAREKKGGGRG